MVRVSARRRALVAPGAGRDVLTGADVGGGKQAAAAGQSANIGQAASNLSNIAINQGNNIANIDANQIAGLTRAATGTSNQLLTYNSLNSLNNPAGGGNPGNLGGSTPVAPAGSNLTYDSSGNITGSAPTGSGDGVYTPIPT